MDLQQVDRRKLVSYLWGECMKHMNKRRIGTVILICTMILSGTAFATDEPSSWAAESINGLKAMGVLDDSLFTDYSGLTTRADFAYLGVKLYEMYTGKVAVAGSIQFTDTSDIWVLKAKQLGIVNGYSDGSFKPNQLIKRDELAALFVNVFKAADINYATYSGEKFSDDAQIANWAKDAVYIAKANGIISGVGENRFDAKSNATMQQALLMFNNGLDVMSDGTNPETVETVEPTTEVPVVEVKGENYDAINECVTFEIELTQYLGRDIKAAYNELKAMYADDVQLLEFPGVGYISIGGKFGQVVAMRCSEDNLIAEVWIGFNSYANKPLDVSKRKETVNGYKVNQGADALLSALSLKVSDLDTARTIQASYDVIGYRNQSDTHSMNVEFTKDMKNIFGLSWFGK